MITRNRLAAVCVIFACALAGTAMGQQPATATSAPSASAGVLKHIPAGTLGYVVVNDLKGSSAAVQKLLTDMGMNAMVKEAVGDDLLAAAIKALNLGDGLDTTGGVAVAMFDGKDFNVDSGELINSGWVALVNIVYHGEASPTRPLPDWPVLLLVPGKDIQSVFGQHKTKPAGEFTAIQRIGSDGYVFAAARDGYIFISPREKVLTAALAEKKSAADELDKDHVALMGESIAAIHVDLARCAQIINGWIKKGQDSTNQSMTRYQDMPDNDPNSGMSAGWKQRALGMMQSELQMWAIKKDLCAQLGQVSAGLRVVKGGMVANMLLTFVDGSATAKEVQSAKGLLKPLSLLPGLDYGAAGSSNNSPVGLFFTSLLSTAPLRIAVSVPSMGILLPRGMNTEITHMGLKFIGMRMAYDGEQFIAGVPERLIVLGDQYDHEVLATHIYAGSAPDKNGLIGTALILECRDAERFKTILAGTCTTISDVLEKPARGQFKLEYKKATADGEPDIVETIATPLSQMNEQGHKTMTAILGDDKISLMVGTVGKNLVVLTLGGKRAMFDEAMKAAKDGGPIAKDKEVVKGMEYMPKNLQTLLAVNGGQVFDLIWACTKASGDNTQPPFVISAKTPLMIGVGATGSSHRVAIFMPADLLRDAANMFMAIMPARAAINNVQK